MSQIGRAPHDVAGRVQLEAAVGHIRLAAGPAVRGIRAHVLPPQNQPRGATVSGEAKWDEAKGRAKEAAGAVSGDDDMKREGKVDQAKSSIKETIDDVKDKANDLVDKVTGKAK